MRKIFFILFIMILLNNNRLNNNILNQGGKKEHLDGSYGKDCHIPKSFTYKECVNSEYKNIMGVKKYGVNRIPIIYYINLKHRTDRKKNIIKEIKYINYNLNNLIRIDSIKINKWEDCPPKFQKLKTNQYIKPGHYGCNLSHIKALKEAQKTKKDYILIIEDDLEWIEKKDIINDKIEKLLNLNEKWNVFLLSYHTNANLKKINNDFYKIDNSQTTSAYIIKKEYIKILLNFWENNKDIAVLDQSWKKLQLKDKWICTYPALCKQKEGYSDILKQKVNYNL